MIVVKFYNSMETELTNDEGPVSENLKLFRHFYYAKMCNLIGLNGVTKEYVNSLTAPDFECTYIDVRNGGFAELHFERIVPKPAAPVQETVETAAEEPEEPEASTDKEALIESINKVIEETPDAPETPEVPETPDAPETPEVPETPDAPETPEVPETPDAPETPEVPETPAPVKRGRGRPKKNQ